MEITALPRQKRKEISAEWVNVATTAKSLAAEGRVEEFVKVGPYSVGVATNIRNGLYPAFLPANDWEADQKKNYMQDHWIVTTRKCAPTRNHVYIRWIGQGCSCAECQ